MSYSKKSYAKWILAGEHTVLRGGSALVFPFKKYFIEFNYTPSEEPLSVIVSPGQESLEIFFWGIVEKALHLIKKKRSDLQGALQINSEIPIGGGLGSSAAISVALMDWFSHLGWVLKSDVFSLSRDIENIIHGESSGVDIVGAMSEEGKEFYREGTVLPMEIHWQPRWALSDCQQKGMTVSCIRKVKNIIESTPELGLKIDNLMKASVELSKQALAQTDQETGLQLLARAIDKANDCFKQWGLVHGPLKYHMSELLKNGALAVKPTGSGDGGYVLSLWPNELSQEKINQLGLITDI